MTAPARTLESERARIGQLLRERAAMSPPAAEPVALARVAIRTRDRPVALARALDSLVAELRRCGRSAAVYIYDDAQDADARERLRLGLAARRAASGVAFYYAGAEEKRAYAERLARAAPAVPRDLIDFALSDVHRSRATTAGAQANAVVLDAAGECTLVVDDDILVAPHAPRHRASGLACSAENDPTEIWLHEDAASVRAALTPADADLFAAHEALLGRTVDSCVAALAPDEALDLSGATPGLLSALGASPGHLIATATGSAGDVGNTMPLQVLALRGEARARFVEDAERYARVRLTRHFERAVARPTVYAGGFFMTMFVGLDARGLLPPFLPTMRNSDGLFALTLLRCFPHSFIGHVPWMVRHEPEEARSFQMDFAPVAGVMGTTQVIDSIVSEGKTRHGSDPRERMEGAAFRLESATALPDADFAALVRSVLDTRRRGRLAMFAEALERERGAPRWWAADVQACMDVLVQALSSGQGALPTDVLARVERDRALPFLRALLRDYGRLLVAWPELLAGARALRERGEGVARAV